jgi:hypothetical protein
LDISARQHADENSLSVDDRKARINPQELGRQARGR